MVSPVEDCVEAHLRRFRTYDRAVDVVSAFQTLFTQSELKSTVVHFERFPTINSRTTASDTQERTPDFTVLFNDDTGLVGEIARVALPDSSVDSLCEQLLAYDTAIDLPASSTSRRDIERADVILLVPADVGPDAADRILNDRLAASSHPYSPSAPPCIMQFLYDEGRYMFQRLPTTGNGIPDDGARDPGLGNWMRSSSSIKVKPALFAGVKAEGAFMNDSPDALYLAALLWTKVLPVLDPSSREGMALIDVRPDDLAVTIRGRFGRVYARDVRKALGMLEQAQLARQGDAGAWRIGWQHLRRTSERDVARVIADRACKPPAAHSVDRIAEAIDDGSLQPPQPLTLFEMED